MKKVKMILYGEPGTGKSVFAGNAPEPFFITTDGNYEWLEGLVPNYSEENHIQIGSYAEFEALIPQLATEKYAKYKTFVLDLIEDLYTWADYELCKKNKAKHISELGDYGKGYDMLRKPFIASILKFIALDKNIIILSHESSKDEKNKRGVVTTKYQPSAVMSIEKLWDKFAGQCQFVIRCYKDYEQDEDGRMVLYRLLNIKNKPEEYGTYRLTDINAPETIELDWPTFAEIIGLNSKTSVYAKEATATKVTSDMQAQNIGGVEEEEKPAVKKPSAIVKPTVAQKPIPAKTAPTKEEVLNDAIAETLDGETEEVPAKPVVAKPAPKVVRPAVKPQPKVEEAPVEEATEEVVEEAPVVETKVKEVETEDLPPKQVVKPQPKPQPQPQPQPQQTTQTPAAMSLADRIAAIKAKAAGYNKK